MMRRIFVFVVMLGMVGITYATGAFAEDAPQKWTVVDLNTQDCRTFLKMTGYERDITVAFYHGVVTGMKKETTVNIPALAEVTDKVMDHCIDNPKDVLLKVFQDLRK
jgi:hypothetical protein